MHFLDFSTLIFLEHASNRITFFKIIVLPKPKYTLINRLDQFLIYIIILIPTHKKKIRKGWD